MQTWFHLAILDEGGQSPLPAPPEADAYLVIPPREKTPIMEPPEDFLELLTVLEDELSGTSNDFSLK